MSVAIFEEMKQYIGFGAQDALHLREIGPLVRPHLAEVVDDFYRVIFSHADTRAVFTGGEQQIQRLRGQFTQWLDSLFGGDYDSAYYEQRVNIGRVHVRIGLPQHFMFAAMERVWSGLERIIRQSGVREPDVRLRALHRLLTLETGIMLQSYKESYSEQVREIERQAVHERLTQSEHLAQIGQLAASLAHEIKNPLAGISGAIQVIRDAMNVADPHRPILAEVLRQIDRLDGTVKDLLVYARPKPPRFRRCNLGHVIERVLTVLRREPELQRVRLEHVDSPQLPFYADEAQIEQVLINLLLNAAQATPDGGRVRLATSSNADGLRLVIEDDGHGMDEEVRKRVFEPFYTTKSKGTGLGLPICQKIVESHGGSISIRSAAGEGTTVTVRIPRYPPAALGEQDEHPRSDR